MPKPCETAARKLLGERMRKSEAPAGFKNKPLLSALPLSEGSADFIETSRDIDGIDTCDAVISSIFLVVALFGILCVILCLKVTGLDPNWALQVWKLSLQIKRHAWFVMLTC